jgi:IclR family transcriptional regulator, KDG regulon repressor
MSKTEHRPTERVLDILELLSLHPEGLTLTEISESIKSPKSTIYPIVHTMSERKFLYLDKNTSRYTIGISAYGIGISYANNMNVFKFIKMQMQNIVSHSKEICQLGVLDKSDVFYIAKVDSDEPIRLVSSVGKKFPAYCTAMGKSLLCNKTLDELKKLYPEGLKAYTENTVTDFDNLYEHTSKIKTDGFTSEFGELNDYQHCVAVPLFNGERVVASLSVSIPAFRANSEKIELIKNLLLEVRSDIERYFTENHVNADTLILGDY